MPGSANRPQHPGTAGWQTRPPAPPLQPPCRNARSEPLCGLRQLSYASRLQCGAPGVARSSSSTWSRSPAVIARMEKGRRSESSFFADASPLIRPQVSAWQISPRPNAAGSSHPASSKTRTPQPKHGAPPARIASIAVGGVYNHGARARQCLCRSSLADHNGHAATRRDGLVSGEQCLVARLPPSVKPDIELFAPRIEHRAAFALGPWPQAPPAATPPSTAPRASHSPFAALNPTRTP